MKSQMPTYDIMSPPNCTEGASALWTKEQREAWGKEYARTHFLSSDPKEAAWKLENATRDFERDLWSFAYGSNYSSYGGNVPDAIQWMVEIVREVSIGWYELSQPKPNPAFKSWTDYKDRLVMEFVGDLHDEDKQEEGSNPFAMDETQAVMWVFGLNPYRIWQVYDACRDAAEEAVRDSLLGMAADDKGTDGDVRKATRKAMEKACQTLGDEFEAYRKETRVG